MPRWKTLRQKTTYELEGLQFAENPEDELKKCFRDAITSAMDACKSSIGHPDRIGLKVNSTRLKYPLWVRFHSTHDPELVVESAMNAFNKINYNADEGSVLGAPFQIEVLSSCIGALQKELGNAPQQINGRGRQRLHKKEGFAIVERGLIKIANQDSLCLFYACEMGRLRYELNSDKYRNFKQSLNLQQTAALHLKNAIKAPNLDKYDAARWCPKIQRFYNHQYGENQYAIYVFNKYFQGGKPIFRTGDPYAKNKILLFYTGSHFNVISSLHAVFNIKMYCFVCEQPYSSKYTHNSKCGAVCINCRTLSGKCFDDGFRKQCYGCQKIFINQKCFDSHLKKEGKFEKSVCNRFAKCNECGVVWDKYRYSKLPQKVHRCGEYLCRTCGYNKLNKFISKYIII